MWTENFDTSPCRFQCSRILSDGDFPHLHLAFLNLLGHFGKYLEENVKLAEGHLSDGLARKTKGKMLTLYELGRRRVRSGPMITNGQTQVLHHLSEIFKFNLEKKIGKFHTSRLLILSAKRIDDFTFPCLKIQPSLISCQEEFQWQQQSSNTRRD